MPEIEKATIKRELFKKKNEKTGRYFVTARNENGELLERRHWNQKDNNIKSNRQYLKTGTFDKDITRIKLVNVNEHTDTSKKPSIPAGAMFSYVVKGKLKDGTTLTARSRQESKGFPINFLQDEARESFFERLSQKILGEGHYDEDEGRMIADKHLVSVREGVIFYTARPQAVI